MPAKIDPNEIDRQVIEFFRSWSARHPWGPSYGDIQHAIGRGALIVCASLERLKDRGIIGQTPYRARSLYLKPEQKFRFIPIKREGGETVLEPARAVVFQREPL